MVEPVRGFLIDVDGVLHVDGAPIPGAIEALAELRARAVPFRLLTNSSTRSRRMLGAALRAMGIEVADDEVLTASAATAEDVRQRHPGQPCYLLARDAVREEFAGVPLTDGDDARVVVIADAGDGFTFAALNHAFRLLHAGAAFVVMHRNPWWETASGPTLDAGAFIRGLEHASGVRARVVGKPSTPFFRAGFRALGLPPRAVAMVGDTLRQDILPAMRLGATGVLVRTGTFREGDLAHGTPDEVIGSIAELARVISDRQVAGPAVRPITP